MKPIQRIMVPTDCSAGADAAAEVAAQLAKQLKASIDVVTVVDTTAFGEIYGDAAYRAERIATIHAEARADAQQFADRHFRDVAGVRVLVRDGNVFLELLQAIDELEAGMVVMGTHGRTGIGHLVIGSVAEKLVRASVVPVLTVRAPKD